MKTNQGKTQAADPAAPNTTSSVTGSVSAKALEYYRMYTANEELPKYFCGDFDLGADDTPTPSTSSMTTVRQLQPPAAAPVAAEEPAASPTSSVRKQLEWDSGADIGYASAAAALQKSASLPTLEQRRLGRHQPAVRSRKQRQHSLHVDSDNSDEEGALLRHKRLIAFIRRKVGLPVAESTPLAQAELAKADSDPAIYTGHAHTPRPLSELKQRKLITTVFNYEVGPSGEHSPNVSYKSSNRSTSSPLPSPSSSSATLPNKTKYFARYRWAKLKSLQIARPVSIECLSLKQMEDCQTQTSHLQLHPNEEVGVERRNHSVGIQTSGRAAKQEILYLFHPESSVTNDGKSTAPGTTSTNSSTRGRTCNSFEYIAGQLQEDDATENGSLPNLEADSNSHSLTTTSVRPVRPIQRSSTTTTSTKEISAEDDMTKSLRLMKMLIKSKKYDNNFKQMCIRKMARRLVQQDGSTESGSKVASTATSTDVWSETPATSGTQAPSMPVNWKESVTTSERLYSSVEGAESTTESPKECLVSFAKRERTHQLQWINSEIEHLAKLKSLLETKKRSTRSTISVSAPDLDYKKSTAVYMITTEKCAHDACTSDCGSRTTRAASGEIDFHVHDALGARDYRFKELVTRITPACDKDAAERAAPPAPSLSASAGRTCNHHHPCDCVSERAAAVQQQQSMYKACRPCGPCPPLPLLYADGCHPHPCHVQPARRQRDIFPTPPTARRSRSPSPNSTSNTDDTSGYPSRRRTPPQQRPPTPPKKAREKRGAAAAGADVRKLAAAAPRAKSDSDTESSHYESLTKYQSKTLSLTKPSRVLTVEEQSPKRIKEVPYCVQNYGLPPPSQTHGPCGSNCFCHTYDYGPQLPDFPPPLIRSPPIPMALPPTVGKKDSYKQYKAAKLKEKELQEGRRSEEKKTKPEKEKKKVVLHSNARDRERPKRARERLDTSEGEQPRSLSEDEVQRFLQTMQSMQMVKKPPACGWSQPQLPRESPGRPPATKGTPTKSKRPPTQPELEPTVTDETHKSRGGKKSQPQPDQRHSKTDSEVAAKRAIAASKEAWKGSKTDSEIASFERFTNTDGPWREEEDDEFVACPDADAPDPKCKCIKSTRNMCNCIDMPSNEKPSKTGTVSLQTIPSPQLIERGVMKDEEPRPTDAKDVQVEEVKPLMKQMAVGDDCNHTGKETASQVPMNKDSAVKAGLSLTPAAVVTYMPSSGDNLIQGGAARPFKMVKDLSKINLSSAIIISSVVASSTSNPGDNIRRLVLEMPLDEREEDGLVGLVNSKSQKKCEKEKEAQQNDSEMFSSLLSCSCLATSSSRLTTTAGSTSEVMCSCCGKCIVSSESSLMLGDNIMAPGSGPFCWPCYCNSTKREWNPADPFYQQPDHMCNCYQNKVDESALDKIRDTLRQLAEIDNCADEPPTASCGKVAAKGDRLICQACNKKIKREASVKKPVAYVLKFEPGEECESDGKPSVQSLQEIRVKVPIKNKSKAGGGGGSGGAASSGSKKKRKCEAEAPSRDPGARNLQEYLSSNRPDFMRSAEERRRCLVELAYMRGQRCKKYQELLALTNGILPSIPSGEDERQRRLFSTKEMKRMTAKNYNKLPEVREKLLNTKKERIKQTNRLIVSIFNQKLRETVLRGQASLSTSISVINM